MPASARDEALSLLSPFERAAAYWREDENPEILDRLNPELRPLVEAVIAHRG
jgi:hypothetical protein